MYKPKINVCFRWYYTTLFHSLCTTQTNIEMTIGGGNSWNKVLCFQNCQCYYYSFCEWTDANTLVRIGKVWVFMVNFQPFYGTKKWQVQTSALKESC